MDTNWNYFWCYLAFYLAVEVQAGGTNCFYTDNDTVAEPAMVETEEEAADIPPPVTADEN